MKYLILCLLFMSCTTMKKRRYYPQERYCPKCERSGQLQTCMERFADKGYDSDALVKICGKIFERRE